MCFQGLLTFKQASFNSLQDNNGLSVDDIRVVIVNCLCLLQQGAQKCDVL